MFRERVGSGGRRLETWYAQRKLRRTIGLQPCACIFPFSPSGSIFAEPDRITNVNHTWRNFQSISRSFPSADNAARYHSQRLAPDRTPVCNFALLAKQR